MKLSMRPESMWSGVLLEAMIEAFVARNEVAKDFSIKHRNRCACIESISGESYPMIDNIMETTTPYDVEIKDLCAHLRASIK